MGVLRADAAIVAAGLGACLATLAAARLGREVIPFGLMAWRSALTGCGAAAKVITGSWR